MSISLCVNTIKCPWKCSELMVFVEIMDSLTNLLPNTKLMKNIFWFLSQNNQ